MNTALTFVSSSCMVNMISRLATAILIGVVVATAIGAASALLFINSEDEGSFTLTYYKNGDKVLEKTAQAGTSVTIIGDIGISSDSGRFIGWNTKPDMSGSTLLSGTQLTINRDVSLHAMVVGSEIFAIVLPEKQIGYTMTADPVLVVRGGTSVISFSLLPSHIRDDLVIAANGNPMKLNALNEIHLTDISEDKVITVTGVYDRREHSISLPEDQIGYVLTSSAETVHHGESYTLEYILLPGYRETSDFGIRVNGGDARKLSGGTMPIEDVMDNHRITVTGVEPILYNISSGKNISVYVNGIPASKATVKDLVTIIPAAGYKIPDTFNGQIKGHFIVDGKGYRITDNVAFPSVLKITAGDNIRMNGGGSAAIFVCPEDKVSISPSSGYSVPDDYINKAGGLNGVTYSAQGFSFSDEAVLPSIYKIVFNGYNKIHATFFVVGGTTIPFPQNNPTRDLYHFNKWQIDSTYVLNDMLVYAIWSPNEYSITFGSNIIYSINSKQYTQPGSYTISTEDVINVSAYFGYELPAGYLPPSVFIKKGTGYCATLDYTLATIYFVLYKDNITNLSKKYFYSESEIHTIINPRTQIHPLFVFNLEDSTYELEDFMGWMCNGQLYVGGTIIVDRDFIFSSSWNK